MTVALITCLVGLVALLWLRSGKTPAPSRLSEQGGNSLDRALCVLIKEVSDTPTRRRPFH